MTTQAPARPSLGVLPLGDGRYAVSSSSPANPPYLVTEHGLHLACTCPAYKYAKDDGDQRRCKHTDSVHAYLNEQYAERRRVEPRYCEGCLMSPVTDGFPLCPSCMADEQRRIAARNAEALALLGWEG